MKSNVMCIQENRVMRLKFMMGLLALCMGARSYADTLCNSNEQAVFSCSVAHHKMASLCAPKDLKAPGLYLQYRFGTHQNIELAYPEKNENPRGRFRKGFLMTGPMSAGTYVVFTLGKYDYYMYEMGSDGMGIAVYNKNKMMGNLECNDNGVSQINLLASNGDYNPFEMASDLNWAEMPGKARVLVQKADSKYYAIPNWNPYKDFRPDHVVADARGFLWVASDNYISKLMPDGSVLLFTGKPYDNSSGDRSGFRDGSGKSALFGSVYDLTIDKGGDIYLVDASNNVIRKVGPDGYVSTVAVIRGLSGLQDGSRGVATIWGDLTVDGSGNLILWGLHKDHVIIRKVDKDGAVSTMVNKKIILTVNGKIINVSDFSGWLTGSLIADSKGDIYVPCRAGGGPEKTAILKIAPSGEAIVFAGELDKVGYVDGKGQSARFDDIVGMVIDKYNNIIVVDRFNHAVRKIAPNGDVSTFLDLNKIPGMRLNKASLATISGLVAAYGRIPQSLAIDNQYNLYITASLGDSDNYLFKVTPSGQVITLWSVTGPSQVVYFRHGSE